MHHDSPYRHIPRGPNARRDSTPSASSAAGVAWNLGDLYSGPGDPALVKDQAATLEAARAFAQEFRGAVAGLDAEALTGALRRLEALHTRAYGPVIFAYLRFAAETAGTGPSGSHNGAALQAAKEHHTAFSEELLFFDLEWQHLPESQAQALLSHPGLSPWRHHLSKVRRMAPYTLSEPEERILAVKENTGRGAFERLFDESTSSLRCLLAGPDQPAAEVSLEQALSLLHHPDRTRRAAAADAITATLRGQERLLGYVMNTIVRDHADEDRLRGRNHPMLARNLANEIEQAGVDALLDACDSGMALVGRYYKLKRRLLGLDRLYDYDRYAPLGTDLPGCSWSEAREIVLSSYAAFSPALAQIVSRFLNESWID
ncbi:MAG: oligoendopeptidase, partial [Deltaproteobacteria bacterium]|nr:oligoendopeptidase [Deltaproteobacteria bacterium]